MAEEIIKRLIETGKITLGSETTIKQLKNGKLRGVVLSVNCPKLKEAEIKRLAKDKGARIYVYPGTSLELGEACGKPFPVSAIGILDYGDADLSELEVSE